MLVSYIALALVLLGPAHALTFSFGSFSLRLSRSAAIFQRATLPGECLAPYAQIVDEDARYMVDNCLRKTMLPVPSWVAPQQSLEASLAVYEPSSRRRTSVVLLHGFDSSCLEWRKLAPILCRHGLHTYAIDVHGWGFGQLEGIADFSYRAKVEHLRSFLQRHTAGTRVVLVGASLGGTLALFTAAQYPELVDRLVLLDAQGFIEGAPKLPDVIARLGVQILKSRLLRQYANNLSYFDKKRFATEDAMRIGRLHCYLPQWAHSNLAFLQSQGFQGIAQKVAAAPQKTLVLWGKQDKVLSPVYATRFQEEMQSAQVQLIDMCGHVPHIEQADVTARAISDFIRS